MKYLIDGNNLMPKIRKTSAIQASDPQGAREMLVLLLGNKAVFKKDAISLYFDGYENGRITSSGISIVYSGNKEADFFIRREIDNSRSRSGIIVVSSDHGIINLAKVCGCRVIKSEEMAQMLESSGKNNDDESETIKKLKNENQEFYDLFSRKKKP